MVGRERREQVGPVMSVAFSLDGKYVISGWQDETIRIWDVVTQEMGEPLRDHQGHVTSIGFSADGRHVASGLPDKTVKMWDFMTQELRKR